MASASFLVPTIFYILMITWSSATISPFASAALFARPVRSQRSPATLGSNEQEIVLDGMAIRDVGLRNQSVYTLWWIRCCWSTRSEQPKIDKLIKDNQI